MPNLLSRLRGLRPALTRRAFWLWAALITLLLNQPLLHGGAGFANYCISWWNYETFYLEAVTNDADFNTISG